MTQNDKKFYTLVISIMAALCGVTALFAKNYTAGLIFLLVAFGGLAYLYIAEHIGEWKRSLHEEASSVKETIARMAPEEMKEQAKQIKEEVKTTGTHRGLVIFLAIFIVIYISITAGSGETGFAAVLAIPAAVAAVALARWLNSRKDGK